MLALSINTQRTPQELISSHIWVPPKKHATYQGPKLNPWEPKQVHTLIGSPSMKYLLASGYNLCQTASTSFPSSEMGLVCSEVNQAHVKEAVQALNYYHEDFFSSKQIAGICYAWAKISTEFKFIRLRSNLFLLCANYQKSIFAYASPNTWVMDND